MATRKFTREEVLEEILKEDLSEEEEQEARVDSGDGIEEKLDSWIQSFDGGKKFDSRFFRENARQVMEPIFRQSLMAYESDRKLTAVSRRLCLRTISAGSVLYKESRLWLGAIYKRLSGRVSVRRPYQAEVTRSIPYDVFTTCRMVMTDLEVTEPECYIASNRKMEVITITSLDLLQKFLSCISAMDVREVKTYFTRKLMSGSRYNHKVKIIVSELKDFGLVYKKNKGQFIIQFHYGEWNSNGFPQHRCEHKLMKYTNVDS